MILKEYRGKRDFGQTREPAGARTAPGQGSLRFVVQKHAARRLHFDFRLEMDGVLKSWAVTKGPSLDPKVKRLAVHVEDHPLDYANFEGVIAEGNYGAGEVIVWDNGLYSPDEDGQLDIGDPIRSAQRMLKGLEQGKLSFTLRGHKLRGSWTLVRTARGPNEWLLIKHRDQFATAETDVLSDERSVISGLTLEDLKGGRLPQPTLALPPEMQLIIEANAREAPFPNDLSPMLAGRAERVFSHPDWTFEPKLDGYRIIAYLRGGRAALRSRNNLDYTSSFPGAVAGVEQQPADQMVMDGELVALNANDLPDFGLLQQLVNREVPSSSVRVVYYVFDLLYLEGKDLRRVPLYVRRALLTKVLVPTDAIQLVQVVEADGDALLEATRKLGLEGIIAKRPDSAYESGARSKAWLKIKSVQEQEMVLGGWTEGKGARAGTFGALLLGFYDGDQLRFAGRVGTGFTGRTLGQLMQQVKPLETKRSAYVGPVDLEGAKPHWTRPELVARVKFANWTSDDRLRAPVFIALRPDIDPRSVSREQAIAPPLSLHSAAPSVGASDVTALLDRLSSKQDKLSVEVQGHRLHLSNLNKELWPAHDGQPAVTKRDLVRYYAQMAPYLLPHLRDRPLTITRWPDGILGQTFYQKHWAAGKPPYVETVRVFSSHNEGDVDFIIANNLPTLVALSQQASVELHPWNSRVVTQDDAPALPTSFVGSEEAVESSVLNYPDHIVFDLDPYLYSGKEKSGAEPELNLKAFRKTVEIAKELRAVLDQLSLSSFVKTSGKTGLHIYVPILRHYDYNATRKACELIGRFLMQQFPKDVTMDWSVSKRTGKVFLDHNQNVRGKNMASIYSLRPVPGAPVSTPVRWEELDDLYPPQFNIRTVPQRLEAVGDLWADILKAKHDLGRLLQA